MEADRSSPHEHHARKLAGTLEVAADFKAVTADSGRWGLQPYRRSRALCWNLRLGAKSRNLALDHHPVVDSLKFWDHARQANR